jgi:hypothetical protein
MKRFSAVVGINEVVRTLTIYRAAQFTTRSVIAGTNFNNLSTMP